MSEWNMLVKRVFADGKKKNAAYKLRDAMKDAKKLYRGATGEVADAARTVVRTARRMTGRKRGGKKSRTEKRRTGRKH